MDVLDTNVAFELVKPEPDAQVQARAERTTLDSLAVTATVLAELLDGITRLPHGRRRSALQDRLASTLLGLFGPHVLPGTTAATPARRRRGPRPGGCGRPNTGTTGSGT